MTASGSRVTTTLGTIGLPGSSSIATRPTDTSMSGSRTPSNVGPSTSIGIGAPPIGTRCVFVTVPDFVVTTTIASGTGIGVAAPAVSA